LSPWRRVAAVAATPTQQFKVEMRVSAAQVGLEKSRIRELLRPPGLAAQDRAVKLLPGARPLEASRQPAGRQQPALWQPAGQLQAALWQPAGQLQVALWQPAGQLQAAPWQPVER
jgi:hypothetical protein